MELRCGNNLASPPMRLVTKILERSRSVIVDVMSGITHASRIMPAFCGPLQCREPSKEELTESVINCCWLSSLKPSWLNCLMMLSLTHELSMPGTIPREFRCSPSTSQGSLCHEVYAAWCADKALPDRIYDLSTFQLKDSIHECNILFDRTIDRPVSLQGCQTL
jgi:hypothetical protein